jgi:hypothetical protein
MDTGADKNVTDTEDKNSKTPNGWHKHWQREMAAADKRLRDYLKKGSTVVQRYLDEAPGAGREDSTRSGATPSRLNLFHKNIATQMAMLYGNTPKIDVMREHYDPDDDVARVAALMYQRMLQADVEPSGEDLGAVAKAVLEDRLLPGMGLARVSYEFDTETTTSIDPDTMEPVEVETVVDERAPIDYVHWQDVRWGWGRLYGEVPWWAFRAWLDKDEAEARFGEETAKKLDYKNQSPGGGDNADDPYPADQKDNVQKAEIWEIWDRSTKKVCWYSAGVEGDTILEVKDDPLRLDGFFPIPKPMVANTTTTLFVPKADFLIAQDLYNDIDVLQSRIRIITDAIKVVGVYDSSAKGVSRMLGEGSENDLIPVDNWAMFAEKGGMRGSVDWFPVQDIVGVLQTLQQVQQTKKEELYEMTGMSDIMRGGNTDQYTAARTQGLKAKMGSIYIQALQEDFARFVSQLESLKAEVIAKHFSIETIVKHSNAGFLPEADKDSVAQAAALIKSPESKWRINIKSESLAMMDYAQIKQERTEFLTSMATYIQSATSAVQAVPGALPVLLELMKWGMTGFKGAEYLEGTMDQAIDMASNAPPGQQEDNGDQLKLQLENMKRETAQMKHQHDMQKMQAKAQMDMNNQRAKIQGEIQKLQMDLQADMTLEERQSKNRLLEISREMEANLAEIQASMQADLTIERAQAEFDITGQNVEHEHNLVELAAQTRNRGAA